MNLDHLRYFVKLTETRHYTKAAEQLCISQPSLSHAIRQLEEELGVPLFEKTGRNTELTRFGAEFRDCVTRSLSVLDAGVASLRRSAGGSGLVRLGFLRALGTQYIPGLAAGFLQKYPDQTIEFSFHTERSRALMEGLAAGRFDLVFSSRPEQSPHLEAVPVTDQELVAIVPRRHPLAGRTAIDLAEFGRYPQIVFAEGAGLRAVVRDLFAAVHTEPPIACETEEDQVVAGLVAAGFGVAVVPRMDVLDKLDVAVLPISNPPYRREICMVRSRSVGMPPVVQNFWNFVREQAGMPAAPLSPAP